MKISVVVNTCCLGARAHALTGSSGSPYSRRAVFIREKIVPRLQVQFQQVIVVGEFEHGTGYEYLPSPSRYFNCRDVLAQREIGFAATKHESIVFQMDDHLVSDDFARQLRALPNGWDVVSPARFSLRTGALLNSGWNDTRAEYRQNPYWHTHVIVMTRDSVKHCPWSGLPPIHRFDVVHSMWFQDAALNVVVAKHLKVFDLEE